MCVPQYALDTGCTPELSSSEFETTVIVDHEFSGKVFFVYEYLDYSFLPPEYTVMITRHFMPDYEPIINRIVGIISEFGGKLSHGAIVAREYQKGFIVINKATDRFFFGDYISYKKGILSREESEFFTSGQPPYPEEEYYPNRMYLYTLALCADWIIISQERNIKPFVLFGDTCALPVKPSEYYTTVKTIDSSFVERIVSTTLNYMKKDLKYSILLNLLQRLVFRIAPEQISKIGPLILKEDEISRALFEKEFIKKETNKIRNKLFDITKELIYELKV